MKKALADALELRGYASLTAVQEQVTQTDLIGADLIVSAQTGSGKTIGFGLAIAPTLLGDQEMFAPAALPFGLILAPTRELAMQVKRELTWLYAKAGATVASCVGGMDMRDERRGLQRGAHIVVATPGRLRDHLTRGSIDLSDLRAVVLDEADEMLDLGFREDLEFILGEAPEERQTLMFSATVPRSITALAKTYQKGAIRVSTTAEKSQHTDIEYQAMSVAGRDAENAIINVLRYFEAPSALVFANTRSMVNRLTTRLSNRGFSVVALSGELSQTERTHALQAMRDGRARVCVATDVAARGIDLPNLDLVVHAELPTNHETLLHRSGRTGRAGRKGVSVLIVPPSARRKAERMLASSKLQADWGSAPSADAVRARDQERMFADPGWLADIAESELEAVQGLLDRFSPDQIAAQFLRLHAGQHSAPEELSVFDTKPKPRKEFGPSVWFSVSGGHSQRAEPRRLIPALCKAGGISSQDIGAIRIAHSESLVEIRQSSVDTFLDAIGPELVVGNGSTLTRVDAPPSEGESPGLASERRSRGAKRARALAEKPDNAVRSDGVAYEAPNHRKTKPTLERLSDAEAPELRARPDTSGAPKTPPHNPKGPPPPKGKATSKKNKARKLAARHDGQPRLGKSRTRSRASK
ncbi:MAG: DEAD/DEAH box helicase [Pseudomonadota bacterium]